MMNYLYKDQRRRNSRDRAIANIIAIYKKDPKVTISYSGVYSNISRCVKECKEMVDLWVGLTGSIIVTTRHGSKTYRRLTDACRAFDKLIA